MANPLKINQRTWRDWTYREWNAALFDYFFRAREGDTAPLSRLVVTGEELQRVTGDEEAPPPEVFEAFRTAILGRLALANRTLCNDARNLEWGKRRNPDAIPPYFGHLVVTCIAASGTASAKRPKGEFRKRLNEFLRRGEDNSSYTLGLLPQLWEMLSKWLERAAGEGEPYRTLVLSRPEHLRIIGYSLELAFPPHRDQRELVGILADIPIPPPVVSVLERIETDLPRFGPRFRQTYHDFRAAYFGGKEGLYRWPFWSAVLDALKRRSHGASATGSASQPRLALRLDTDAEWHFALTVYTDLALDHLKGLRSVPAEEFSLEGFPFLLTGQEPELHSVPSLLLEERLPADLRSPATADICRTVAEGVLFFQMNEEGVWLLTLSRPGAGSLRALIRSDLMDSFFGALCEAGADPTKSEALYAGWHEVDGLDALHLGKADFVAAGFDTVRCLADVIAAPRISIHDGVRLGNAWLGRRQSLPRFSCEIESPILSIRPRHSHEGESVALEGTQGEGTEYAIPPQFLDGRDLNGEFLIRCTVEGRNEATRAVEFLSNVLTHDYPFPASPEAWFGEGGRAPTEDLPSAEELPSEVTTVLEGFSLTQLSNRSSVAPSAIDEPTDALVDTLAAMSLRRRGISESDVYSAFRRVLGLEGAAIWDVTRAWVEAGVLDSLTFRRWRKRAYFARRPRLVLFSKPGRQIAATLTGLVPSGLCARLKEEAPKADVRIIRVPPQGPTVPGLIGLEARSKTELLTLSESLGLATPRALLPLEEVVCSIETAIEYATPPVRNHLLAGTWSWEKQRFVTGNYEARVSVDWYKREDTPDTFLVRSGEEAVFSTRSRTWAFLVATTLRGERVFVPKGQGVLRRSHSHRFHLPIALGRWCAFATGIAPAPILAANGFTDYVYAFPGRKEQEAAMGVLWPSTAPKRADAKTRWLLSLARSGGHSPGSRRGSTTLVPLPEALRRELAEASEASLPELRMIPAWLLPRLRALTTPSASRPIEVRKELEA